MPLPVKMTPREQAEVTPAALSARARSEFLAPRTGDKDLDMVASAKRLTMAVAAAKGFTAARDDHGRFAGGGDGATAASTRAAVASAEARRVVPGGFFSNPGTSRSAVQAAVDAHEAAATAHEAVGSHDWARYHSGQADEERRALDRATRKGNFDDDALDADGGKLVPDQGSNPRDDEVDPMRDPNHRPDDAVAKDWDESSHPRSDGGRFGAGSGGGAAGKPAAPTKPNGAPNPRATPLDKPNAVEVAAWRAAGGAAKLAAGVKGAMRTAIDKIKASPGALKHAVMHEVGLVKQAGAGLKAAVTGKEVTSDQKAAMRSVALKIAVKLAFAAVGAALPGVGHAVGAAIEHAVPHFAEAVAHFVAHHAAEHTVEHMSKHAAQRAIGVQFKAAIGGDDGTELFTNTILAGIQDALASMSDKDWDGITSGTADTSSAEDAGLGDFASPDSAPPVAVPGNPPAGGAKNKPSKGDDAHPTPAKKNTPQVPGPDRRVGGAAPGAGYTVRRDTPIGYGIAGKAGEEEHVQGYDAPAQPLPTGKADGGRVYKKVAHQGIPVHVDRPAGFVQKGIGDDGVPWSRTYKLDYGFIPGTRGGDGEGLDVFLGPKANAPDVHWAVQQKADGQFDEFKCIMGFEDADDARKAYIDHIPEKYLRTMKSTSVQMVRALLGLEPVDVMKALLADSFEDAIDAATAAVDKASVHVREHPRSSGGKVREHERRAPLSPEEKAPKPEKGPKASGGRRGNGGGRGDDGGGNGLNVLHEANSVHDARSLLHATTNVLTNALGVVAGHAAARANATSDRSRDATAFNDALAEHDKNTSGKGDALTEGKKVAAAHEQARAEHARAAVAAAESGDKAGAEHHTEAAIAHATAAEKIRDALDRLHADLDDKPAWGDLKSAVAEGEAHAAAVSTRAAATKPDGTGASAGAADAPKPAADPKPSGGDKPAADPKPKPKPKPKDDGGDKGKAIEARIASGTPGPVGAGHSDIERWITVNGHVVPITEKSDERDAEGHESESNYMRGVIDKDTYKASVAALSRDSMTRPYVPVIPAADGTGTTGEIEEPEPARKATHVEIVHKAADDAPVEERYVLGIVLKPSEVDSQGDIYSADEIKKTAFQWMAKFRNMDLQHKVLINHLVEPVESYIAPADFTLGSKTVKRGTWLLGVHVIDDDIWGQVKSGALTGFSISGLAKRVPIKTL